MDKFYFGTHINVYENYINSTKLVKKFGGNFVQIFITIPGQQKTSNISNKDLIDFKTFLMDNDMKVVVHSSYLHNLARDWDPHSWWLKNLELEIKYASVIGAIGVVIHFGKRMELSIEEAYNNMYTSLIYIHNKTKKYKDVKLILETSTGQGTEICYKLEDLGYFYKKFSKNNNKEIKDRIKLCVDTCHVFAAGYDLKTKDNVDFFLQTFEELIGLNHIYLIHLNDSKMDVGSNKDRHENIGEGHIGIIGLDYFFKYFRNLKIPIILETPGGKYEEEIKLLKS
ncbi:Apurinic/apyrimidinic (AP) endonuclease [uncultured virus]|nr:Apurinic/apyrimidinic (AP) endonuclease [uncultured virus]